MDVEEKRMRTKPLLPLLYVLYLESLRRGFCSHV
jgi:hypothetical protein